MTPQTFRTTYRCKMCGTEYHVTWTPPHEQQSYCPTCESALRVWLATIITREVEVHE